ncbi:sushi domain-containing protein 2-like [Anneissia japonica]|uniref:sushi domain-containing protein 2-like n=1 Tax=Anneissia japonica TaxID=1529436 RepID=UPI0014257D05|nr:sushi domain-containing protein 2-like [Anneissia japonica]
MKIHRLTSVLFFLFQQCLSQDIFFPYGTAEGDIALPTNDDGSSGIYNLSTLFPFFDHDHDFLYKGNRLIAYIKSIIDNCNDCNRVYYGDILWRAIALPSINYASSVWCSNSKDDIDKLEKLQLLMARCILIASRNTPQTALYGDLGKANDLFDHIHNAKDIPNPYWAFAIKRALSEASVHSWNEEMRNTFQAILVTDGYHSFTFFHYGNILWTTGTASGGSRYTGLGGTAAQVGFNAGNGITFYSVPGSRNASIVDVEETTNVGVIGRWVFRTDVEKVTENGCTDKVTGTVTVFPCSGSMLGGDRILIQGPCFHIEHNITCKFINPDTGPETQGVVLGALKAECVTPILFQTGKIKFYVSIDGGLTFGFTGEFTISNIDNVVAPVTLEYYDLSRITVTWDTSFTQYQFVNIELFTYLENWETLDVTLERQTIKEKVDGASGVIMFNHNDVLVDFNDNIGIIRVSKWDSNGVLYVPGVWSDVFDLGWLHEAQNSFSFDTWCYEWGLLDDSLGNFLGDTRSCPCTLQQALADISRYTLHSACDLPSNYVYGCEALDYIPQCVRANTPSESGSGLECCYGPAGELLNIQDYMYAGFSHRRHYKAMTPHGVSGQVPYLSHFAADILPYRYSCFYSQQEYCTSFKIRRPSDDCTGYVPPRIGGGNGDPHIRTLDGISYTFNGHGEYTLVEALNGRFVMQSRTEPITGTYASRFTAIAAEFNGTDSVHIGLSERRGLDVRIKSERGWQLIDFECDLSDFWDFNGMSVYKPKGTGGVRITVVFDAGIAFTIGEANDVMSIIFLGSETMKGNTRGLLGTWNDDWNDDFLTPNGFTLHRNATLPEIHFNFGELWRIDPENSLFYYEPGKDNNDYSDSTFIPIFDPPNNVNVDEVQLVCGDIFECIFDYQVTENPAIAKGTRTSVDELVDVVDSCAPVVACPFVSAPINGTKNGALNVEGSHLIFSCDHGFDLLGSDRIVCEANGIWSNNPPVCQSFCDKDCLNGGTCKVNNDSTSVCQCPYGFVGPTCNRIAVYCPCALP